MIWLAVSTVGLILLKVVLCCLLPSERRRAERMAQQQNDPYRREESWMGLQPAPVTVDGRNRRLSR